MKANATRVRNWLNSTDALNEEDSVQQEHKKLLREAWKRRRRLRIDANDENEDDDETSNGSWTSIAAAVVREDNAWNRVVERLVRTVGWVVVWQSLTSLLFVNDFAIANKVCS